MCFYPENAATFDRNQWHDDNEVDQDYEILSAEGTFPQGDDLYDLYSSDGVALSYSFGMTPGSHDLLCCNSVAKDCTCSKPYTFHDAYLFYEDQFIEQDYALVETTAYLRDPMLLSRSLCESCIYFAKPACKNFRNWLRASFENYMVLEDDNTYKNIIEPCEEYEPNDVATYAEVEFITKFIHERMKKQLGQNTTSNINDDPYYDDFHDPLGLGYNYYYEA